MLLNILGINHSTLNASPSRLGMGTYLGELSETFSEKVAQAITWGVNHLKLSTVDTAINYRCQRSERLIGQLLETKKISRDKIFLTTKGGFIPFDQDIPRDGVAYTQEKILGPLRLSSEDIIEGCHCLHPKYIEWSLNQSLKNLHTDTVDIYFLHNPEFALSIWPKDIWEKRMVSCLELLEQKTQAGVLKSYGLATWQGLRVPAEHVHHISLARLIQLCQEKFDPAHFRAIQLPVNATNREFLTLANQDQKLTVQDWAQKHGFVVLSSAPLLQGQLVAHAQEVLQPQEWRPEHSPTENLLSWVLRVQSIQSTLLGTSSPEHLSLAAHSFLLPCSAPQNQPK